MSNVINFYKGIELKYSVYSNSLEDVKNNPLNYFPEYTDDMFITDKNFQYPIIKNNELMEMTREERIEQGIEKGRSEERNNSIARFIKYVKLGVISKKDACQDLGLTEKELDKYLQA